MSGLEVGQVIVAKIRFNNSGLKSSARHPYLIVGIDEGLRTIEIAQLDSLEGKEYKAAMKSNKVIYCDEPIETVIDKDSYIQLDNTFLVELYGDLTRYRRQIDKLSEDKLNDVLKSYQSHHENHHIDENKQVYMGKEEFESLQNT